MPAPRSLIVGENAWRATTSLLAPYATAKTEAGLYWYGIRNSEAATVCVVGIPHQTNHETNFDVVDHDLATLVRALPDELVAVAQIHTHPGSDTMHSKWDDELVVSRKILSLVLPGYGHNPVLQDIGVHEYVDGRWRPLSPVEIAERIVIAPAVVDTR